ncbi:MAG: PASTA domain-containing protein [Nocardioides sp.]
MDVQAYAEARHATLVRAVVLLGRSPQRATELVDEVLRERAGRIRRTDDPDPLVLADLAARVRADRVDSPVDARVEDTLDPLRPIDEDAVSVRTDLAALPYQVRDAAVLLLLGRLDAVRTARALGVRPRDVGPLLDAAFRGLGADGEDHAHALLALAAGSVAASPPPDLSLAAQSRGRTRVTALVGVALVALAGVLALLLHGPGDPPTPPAPVVPDPSGGSAAARVPSVYGLPVQVATQRLQTAGLKVHLATVSACEPSDRALDTDPAPGAAYEPHDPVTLLTAARGGTGCGVALAERSEAWHFLDFAAGVGPAPAFAPTVRLVVDGVPRGDLTAAGAADRRGWDAVLDAVGDAVALVRPAGGEYVTPRLDVATGPPPPVACGVRRPAAAGHRAALELRLVLPNHPPGCAFAVELYRGPAGIDLVAVRHSRRAADPTATNG